MSFRRTGKLLTLVGFVICLSLLGILYGNLSTITEERDSILVKKNEIKQEVGELNNRISSLQEKISRLESSLNKCNSDKLEAEEKRGSLQQEAESLKKDIEHKNVEVENVKSSSEQEIRQLKAQLTETQLEKSGHQEAADACRNTNEDLLAQLNAGKERISHLEKTNLECEGEKRRLIAEAGNSNKEAVDVKKDDSSESEGEGGQLNPVAAVPAPAEEGEKKEEPVDVIDHVADIPEAPKDNAVVDTNQAIPEAQAPAPVAQAEQPVVPGDIGGAVAPAPGKEFKRDTDEEQLPDIMGAFQPLQPIPEDALAESLDKVRQEEQLQQLQERQEQLQQQLPQFPDQNNVEPGNDIPDLNLQPALPPEMQPALPPEVQAAQPAPIESDHGDSFDADSEQGNSDNVQDNAVDNEVQMGLLPEGVPV